jgi:hypothetical protein
MKRGLLALAFVIACGLSAAIGFWFGFREAFPLGVAADFLPRGSIAVAHLRELRAGKTGNLATALEFDVDNGLIWGNHVFSHPLRNYLNPLWGYDIYPEYEKYATRLADYRKEHPSALKGDMFDAVPPEKEQYREVYRELADGTRKSVGTINSMVERYATKR